MNIAVLEPYSDRDEFEEFKWDIKKCFENTRWGNFVSTCKIGKDFGSLKEMDI